MFNLVYDVVYGYKKKNQGSFECRANIFKNFLARIKVYYAAARTQQKNKANGCEKISIA